MSWPAGISAGRVPDGLQAPPTGASQSFREAMAQLPLMIADRTYNTSHPDYDAALVRNLPGTIFNVDRHCANEAFQELTRLAIGKEVPDTAWEPILADALAEASSVPHADQVFERRTFIENYLQGALPARLGQHGRCAVPLLAGAAD
jgi:hypothetical protein